MESRLLTCAFVIGIVGWLCGLVSTRSQRSTTLPLFTLPRPFLISAGLLPILVFLATLPSQPPVFASGHGFGWGFLIGGLGALLAGWSLARLIQTGSTDWKGTRAVLTTTAPCFLAVAALSLPRMFLHDVAVDALAGTALGWLCVSFLLLLGVSTASNHIRADVDISAAESLAGRSKAFALALSSGIGFAVLLSGITILGEYREMLDLTAANSLHWSVFAVLVGAMIPLLLLIGGLPAPFFTGIAHRIGLASIASRLSVPMTNSEDMQRAGIRAWRGIGACLLLAMLGWLLTKRVVDADENQHLARHLFQIIDLGILGGLLAWWLTATRSGRERELKLSTGGSFQYGAVTALVILSGVMVGYEFLAGFGVGLFLLAAWLPVSLATASAVDDSFQMRPGGRAPEQALITAEVAQRLITALLFGVMLVLYRAFETRFHQDLTGVTLTDHYAVFGFLLGALVPSMLSSYLLGLVTDRFASPSVGLMRLVVAGALTLGIPTLIIALWGAKCALALLIGLALSTVVNNGRSFRDRPEAPLDKSTWEFTIGFLPVLFALAMGLALTQWTSHVLPLAQLTRLQKVHVVEYVAGALIVLLALADLSSRLGNRNISQTTAAPVSGGAAQ